MANNSDINAYCSICGKGYKRCATCVEQKTLKPWRSVVDTIECYRIYLAIHGYTVSKNKAESKAELGQCDLSGLDSFKPEIKAVIKEIMSESKKSQAYKRRKNDDVLTNTAVSDSAPDNQTDNTTDNTVDNGNTSESTDDTTTDTI